MATIQLGAMVTNIAGSIGGTTFKRGVGNISIYNKTRGGSKNGKVGFNYLAGLGVIFRAWRALNSATQLGWNDFAARVQFPDKFGVLRNITGRELFIKCQAQLSVVGIYDPETYSSVDAISEFVIDSFVIEPASGLYELIISQDAVENYILVQAEYFSTNPRSPVFNRKKVLFFQLAANTTTFDLGFALSTRFPYMAVGGWVRLYVTPMAQTGLRGATQVIISQVT